MKKILMAAALCMSSMIFGAVLFAPQKAADFTGKNVKAVGKKFTGKGQFATKSVKKFAIDPAKKYKISCKARLAAGTKGAFYIGFDSYDAKGRAIRSGQIFCTSNSGTELAAAAAKGAREIYLKDASKWNTKARWTRIAFNAKNDFSDLPSREALSVTFGSLAKKEGKWVLKLQKPLAKSYAAGTKVRQHIDSDYYQYVKRGSLSSKPTVFSAVVSGRTIHGLSYNKFWPGTAKVQALIFFITPDKKAVVEFEDFRFEEVK